jgi:hypothetical protein
VADDLFGPKRHEHWSRFTTPVVVPRKKSGKVRSSQPAPQPRREPDEIDRNIQRRWAEDAYYSAIETLPQWKHRMSAEDYAKLQAHVAAMKPEWIKP